MFQKLQNRKVRVLVLVLALGGLIIGSIELLKRFEPTATARQTSDDLALQTNQPAYRPNNLLIGRRSEQELKQKTMPHSFSMEVPLDNQMAEPALPFGCEVTALGMLLGYYGYDVSKNQLQDQIEKQPYYDEEGRHGNPNLGFVGDATGEELGAGVFFQPVADLAQTYVGQKYAVMAGTTTSLAELLVQVQGGHPVWVITTIDYSIPTSRDFTTWQTADGPVEFSPKHHAAVITGFDETSVFLNDPYGKTVTVKKATFEKIYKNMGSQSIYLKNKSIS